MLFPTLALCLLRCLAICEMGKLQSTSGNDSSQHGDREEAERLLEYVLVHEMLHLVEPTHNAHFIALIDRFMPRWQLLRQRLNRLPVRHEDWVY